MSLRTALIGGLVVGAVALVAAWTFYRFNSFDGTYRFDTLALPDGREIELRADAAWEISQPICYRVPGSTKSGVVMFRDPSCVPRFQVLSAEGGNLVAIVEATEPDVVLMLHDLQLDDSWPYQFDDETWRERHARGQSLLKRLLLAFPGRLFVLSHDVGG